VLSRRSRHLRLSDGSLVTKLSVLGFAAFIIDEGNPVWVIDYVPDPNLVRTGGSGIILRYSSDYPYGGAVARYDDVIRALRDMGVGDQAVVRDVTGKYVSALIDQNGSPWNVVSDDKCIVIEFASSKIVLYCSAN